MAHPGPVSRAPREGRPPRLDQARQYWGGLTFPYRDDPCDEPTVLRYVDRLAVPDPRQHLTRVVPQVPQTYRVRIRRHHETQCITNLWLQRTPAGQPAQRR